MTTISGNRPVTAPTQTSSTQSTKPAAAATQRQAATGYASNDSFTPAPSVTPKAISEANEQLNKFPAGPDRDAVAKLLNTQWTTDSDMNAAQDALKKLAEKAPDGMTEADFNKIQNGIMFKGNQNTMMGMVIGSMQKMIDEARARGDKKD